MNVDGVISTRAMPAFSSAADAAAGTSSARRKMVTLMRLLDPGMPLLIAGV
jgi:hypothetical protein